MTDTAIAKTFAPLTEEERSHSAANDNAGREELLTTVPPDAPQPDFSLRGFKVSLVSDYQNLDGSLSNYVVRYHKIDANGSEVLDEKGKPRKTFRPWSVLRQADGTLTWTQKGVNAPRQVLNVLAVKNATNVAVVEGEQCVERMRVFSSEWVPTTWQGGANSVGRTDWSTLRGKTIIAFPDLDDAGQTAMKTVSEHCFAAGVARFGRVRIERIAQFTVKDGKLVPREGQVAKGFDVGDLAAEGMTWNMLVEHLGEENLVEWDQPPEDAGIPEDYALEDGRLSRFVPSPNGDVKRMELCSWIRVAGLARDCNSQGWEILVQLRDPDGLVHEELIPYAELAGDGTTAYARLKSRGLRSMGGKGVKNSILSCLEMWETPVRIRMVPTAGHHDGRFVTPSKVYGPIDGDELRLDRRNLRPGQMTEYKGTKELADELASLCVGNSRLVLALSTAFVGPLLHLLGIEGGGLHFKGESSIGKTTLVKIAKTPYGYSLQTWRGTDNGLEGVAANHSDLLLVLDEIGESDGRVAGRVVYMLANGTGKLRADARGEARTPKTWRLVFLSTGEKTLAEMMAEAGQTIKAGQEIRMIEIEADAGAGMGIFENIHGFPSPAAFADHLVALSDRVAGLAGDEYLTKLMADVDSAVATVKTHMDSFMATYCPAGAVGQVSRVYRRMALTAAAGELATSLGVLPWTEGEATAAAAYCASDWVDRRGGVGSSEAMRCIESVMSKIERYGSSRFDDWIEAPLSTEEIIADKAHIRYGWRRMQNDHWEYYATPDGWAQLHEGFSKELANKALVAADILKPGNDRTPKPVTVPGYKKQRLYHIVPPSEDDADA